MTRIHNLLQHGMEVERYLIVDAMTHLKEAERFFASYPYTRPCSCNHILASFAHPTSPRTRQTLKDLETTSDMIAVASTSTLQTPYITAYITISAASTSTLHTLKAYITITAASTSTRCCFAASARSGSK